MSHPLLARLGSRDPEERHQACLDAVADPSAVLFADALGRSLGDPVKAVATAAADALVALSRQHDVLPTLRSALHEGDDRRRLMAALTWARLQPPDARLLPALVAGLGLPDGKLRWWAAKCLVETGRMHGEVLPLLIGLSRSHEDPVARRMAHHCLRELGRDDPHAARALLDATRDPDVRARRAAYAALAALLDPPPEVLARLAEALEQEDDGACRRIATVALGALLAARPERDDAGALAALRRARSDGDDPDLRRGAERALALIERGQ